MKRLLTRLFYKLFGHEIQRIMDETFKMSAARIDLEVGNLRDQLKALQAIDVCYKDRGKVIIIANVNGKDIVKIIEISKGMSFVDYQDFVKMVEMRYGAQVRHMDSAFPNIPLREMRRRKPGGGLEW